MIKTKAMVCQKCRREGSDWEQECPYQMELMLLEKIGRMSGEKAYCYALKVVKGRWEEGEDAISKSAIGSCFYSRDIIKGRFEKGEEAMRKYSMWWIVYRSRMEKMGIKI